MKNWTPIYFSYFLPMLTAASIFILIAGPSLFSRGEVYYLLFLLIPLYNWLPTGALFFAPPNGISQGFVFGVFGFWLLVGVVFFVFAAVIDSIKEGKEKERQRRNAEQSERDRQNAAHARAVSEVAAIVSSAQVAAAGLPLTLSAAESALDLAQKEFSEGLYSPFWEAMEESVLYLKQFEDTLANLEQLRQRYAKEASGLNKPEVNNFALGINLLPDPRSTRSRMTELFRKAQKDGTYAQIYEQRKNTRAVIAGFRSLGDAIYSLGDRVVSALDSLESSVSFRLTDIESALRESNMQLQRQHSALLQEAKMWQAQAQNGQS